MTQTTVQLALGKQKIIEDIKVLLNDSEELLRLSATLPGEGVEALRSRLRDHVDSARGALEDAQASAQTRYRAGVDCTEKYVKENPWQSLGIAAGVGFLLGLIVSR
ncbi:membrane protein [Caballeronia peredens]|nr:membrane protein [Caballeronia peredens]